MRNIDRPVAESDEVFCRDLLEQGFVIVPGIANDAELEHLRNSVERLPGDIVAKVRQGSRYGVRDLLRVIPAAREWAWSSHVLKFVRSILGDDAKPVKGILFDKTAQANWAVPWHQDLTIAVQKRCDLPGYELWSEKDGIPHVQPPVALLERVIAVRLHLDDCPAENGALRVIPGTHLSGKLTDEQVTEFRRRIPELTCEAKAGDALFMHPLVLHASSSSRNPGHRRVMHFEYSATQLPLGLQWCDTDGV